MQYLRERFNPPPEPRPMTWRDEMGDDFKDCCPTMSYETRLYGFGICLLVGALLAFLSTLFLSIAKITMFAIFYSFGSILGLFSTMFLVGPMRQLKMMFHKNRWIATTIYLVVIALTLFVGLYRGKIPARVIYIILLVIIQFLAAIWYSLSYIPYARKVVNRLTGGICECII